MITMLTQCVLFMIVCYGVSVIELRRVFTVYSESDSSLSYHYSKSSKVTKDAFHYKHENFTYFTFTQAWPTSVCMKGEEELHHTCNKVLNLTGWTIHGLWPSSGGKSEDQPENCNKTAKFKPNTISSLVNDLNKYWPNLFSDTPKYEFWEHEWVKHGTCASSVKKTANEYLYFLQGLNLFKQINLNHIMEQLKHHPDDNKQIDVRKLLRELAAKLNGIPPIIGCFKSKKDNKFYLDQIEVCYSKWFQMFDCLKKRPRTLFFKALNNGTTDLHLESCPSGGQVYYPTIHG